MKSHFSAGVLAVLLASITFSPASSVCAAEATSQASNSADPSTGWSTLITATELHERLKNKNLLVIDARSPGEYAAGHVPGAISLPGADWRTPPAAPGSGQIGQRIFRKTDGSIDVERYEKFLGAAGVRPEDDVVVYGNYAGKADGSIPVAILIKLGHQKVGFLDGVGLDEWKAAGYPVTKQATTLPPTTYKANPDLKRLWSYDDVVNNLDNPAVVIIDSRTPEEYAGKDLRGNKRGGHIPGAILLNAEDFLDPASHKTVSADVARRRIEAAIPKDKTVVIYCQSGTRCSHKEIMLRDLGYKNVVLYDASWQEWGNRADAPVEKSDSAPAESDSQ